jgi:coenzyme Q-binding protein COQ10
MRVHAQRYRLPYSCEQVFDLVADVARYPEFVPGWAAARVIERKGDVYRTDQVVRFGTLRERFHTRTVLRRPRRIDVISTDRPFRALRLQWTFTPAPGGGCDVALDLTMETRSALLEPIAERLLARLADRIVAAFEVRARHVYGSGNARARTPSAGDPPRT